MFKLKIFLTRAAICFSLPVFCVVSIPAHAQKPQQAQVVASQTDPVATLRSLYDGIENPREREPFSKRLGALHDAAVKQSQKLDQPVSGLDFDYAIDGQDFADGLAATARYDVLSKDAKTARIRVSFKSFGPKVILYDMVHEGGTWLIDDVRNEGEDPWVLSKLLKEGAAAK